MVIKMEIKYWDPGKVDKKNILVGISRLIRIEHTFFSLPFAYLGSFLASRMPTIKEVILVGIALFGLRMAAMSYNNIADYEIDKMNPRTKNRPLVSGEISFKVAWIIVITGLVIYFISAYMLNLIALFLSPIPAIIVLTYPYAKRVHSYPHFHLGLSLGLVVIAGYVAIEGSHSDALTILIRAPWIWVLAITSWVAGFDIVYSIMDLEFDRKNGLGSIPSKFGVSLSIKLSGILHATFIFLSYVSAIFYDLGIISLIAISLTSLLIVLSHALLTARGELNIQKFFNINLIVGVVLSIGVIIDKIIFYGV